MTNGKRNRAAGHGWERKLVDMFKKVGFEHVVTTRSESKSRDDDKIDLMNKNERKNGQFVFNVQAKNVANTLKYAELLREMPNEKGIINVVAHKQTKRVGTRFVPQGTFMIMSLDHFFTLISIAVKEGLLTPELVKIYESNNHNADGVGATNNRRAAKKLLPGVRNVPME
jgi:hypothetical protein